MTITAAESPYSVPSTVGLVLVNASAGPVDVELYAPARGRVIVKALDAANPITITAAGAATIDGATSRTITVQYQAEPYESDGSAWYVT